MKNVIDIFKNNFKSIIVIVLVVIAGFAVNTLTKKDKVVPTPIAEVPIGETIESNKPANKTSNVSKLIDPRSYSELVIAYKDRMVQFGDGCQNHINNQVFKIGTSVLLDNRNNVPVNIKIGNYSYNLSAYGYEVVTLNSEGKFLVDCNAYQNVSTITVQK